MIWLVAMVQLVNVLDFVMVMPLGRVFARALAIDESRLGLIGGSYTLAAAIAGLVGSRFLDRFDRRSRYASLVSGSPAVSVYPATCGSARYTSVRRFFLGQNGRSRSGAVTSDNRPPSALPP